MEARYTTVGPVQENCWILRAERSGDERSARGRSSDRGLIFDPGEEPDRLLAVAAEMGVTIEAILLTHTHFDHVGAVAPVARATGAPVYCPELEVPVLADIMRYVPWEGFGPYESYAADETVSGGERLELAGLELDVLFVPGHSPGHVAYSIPAESAVVSGDVLFQGSIGRTDLPGGDHATLLRSIQGMLERLPDDTAVLPGHMGPTTLGRERATNPFLQELHA